VIISLAYLGISVASAIGFVRAWQRTKSVSFRAGFLGTFHFPAIAPSSSQVRTAIAFFFSLDRFVLTFFHIHNWSKNLFALYLFSYFLPIYGECASFSLLVLFVCKSLYIIHEREDQIRKCLYPIFYALQVALSIGCFVSCSPFAFILSLIACSCRAGRLAVDGFACTSVLALVCALVLLHLWFPLSCVPATFMPSAWYFIGYFAALLLYSSP